MHFYKVIIILICDIKFDLIKAYECNLSGSTTYIIGLMSFDSVANGN